MPSCHSLSHWQNGSIDGIDALMSIHSGQGMDNILSLFLPKLSFMTRNFVLWSPDNNGDSLSFCPNFHQWNIWLHHVCSPGDGSTCFLSDGHLKSGQKCCALCVRNFTASHKGERSAHWEASNKYLYSLVNGSSLFYKHLFHIWVCVDLSPSSLAALISYFSFP